MINRTENINRTEAINWVKTLRSLLRQDQSVILVTVVAVRGSAPREVGAKILVTTARQFGTIGGGNLEYQAVAVARECLAVSGSAAVVSAIPFVRPYALGPSLGQCCGGYVELMFEKIDQSTGWLGQAFEADERSSAERVWLCRSTSNAAFCFVEIAAHNDRSPAPNDEHLHNAVLLRDASSQPTTADELQLRQAIAAIDETDAWWCDAWWCELLTPSLPEIWVFGAGHVGTALHEQLRLLPCHSIAIDSRDEMLTNLPPGVRVIASDECAAEVAAAPANAWYLVMTHSHAVDFDICHAVLKRGEFSYLGLIGSATKRVNFARRLERRGIEPTLIDRMISPIGLPAIQSRLPQLIALGVAADLVQRWQGASDQQAHRVKKRHSKAQT